MGLIMGDTESYPRPSKLVIRKMPCPRCNAIHNYADTAVGREVECKCGRIFRLGRIANKQPKGALRTSCPKCGHVQHYLPSDKARAIKCGICDHPYMVPGKYKVTAKLKKKLMSIRCPSCDNKQDHYMTHVASKARCNHCDFVWMVNGMSTNHKLHTAECPECGRTYSYNLTKPLQCPACRALLRGKKMDLGKQGRCESIW